VRAWLLDRITRTILPWSFGATLLDKINAGLMRLKLHDAVPQQRWLPPLREIGHHFVDSFNVANSS